MCCLNSRVRRRTQHTTRDMETLSTLLLDALNKATAHADELFKAFTTTMRVLDVLA